MLGIASQVRVRGQSRRFVRAHGTILPRPRDLHCIQENAHRRRTHLVGVFARVVAARRQLSAIRRSKLERLATLARERVRERVESEVAGEHKGRHELSGPAQRRRYDARPIERSVGEGCPIVSAPRMVPRRHTSGDVTNACVAGLESLRPVKLRL